MLRINKALVTFTFLFSAVANANQCLDGTILYENIGIKTGNGHYFVAEGNGGGELNANRNSMGPWEKFSIIRNGDCTFSLQTGNGHYVVAEQNGGDDANANRSFIGPWEKFNLIKNNDHTFSFKTKDGYYFVAEGNGGGAVNANRTSIGPWEKFTFVKEVNVGVDIK